MTTRKLFLRQMGGGCLTLVLAGCGGGGGGGDDNQPQPSGRCNNFLFTGNHGHTLEIPAADLDSRIDKTYSVQGSATHDHPFIVTAANFARLKAGQAIVIATTGEGQGHTHDVSGSCA